MYQRKFKSLGIVLVICMVVTIIGNMAVLAESGNSYDVPGSKFSVGGNNYVLMGERTNVQNGEKEFLIMAEKRYGGENMLTFDNTNKFMYNGNSLDSYREAYFPDMAPYMVQTSWDCSSGGNMTSYLSLPLSTEVTGNASAKAIVSNNGSWMVANQSGLTDMTATRQLWSGDNINYVIYYFSGTNCNVSTKALNSSQNLLLNFVFYVNKNFFENVPLENVSYAGNDVKKAIAQNTNGSMLISLYGKDTASILFGFAYTNAAGSGFTVNEKKYVMLNMRTNAQTGKKEYLIMAENRYGGANYLAFNNVNKFMYNGNSFDFYKDTYFPEMSPYMVQNNWDCASGGTMTAYLCLPSPSEITGNANAKSIVSVNGSWQYWADTTATRQLWSADNVTYVMYYFSGTGDNITTSAKNIAQVSNSIINFVFYVNEDFFKSVKCEVAGMENSVKASINASVSKADLSGIYNEAEIHSILSCKAYDVVAVSAVQDSKLDVDVSVVNNTMGKLDEVKVILASYAGRSLLSARMDKISETASGNTSEAVSFNIADLADVESVRLFVWDNLNSLVPIDESREILILN